MGMFRHIFAAWLAGEIDPMMHGRVDTEQYGYGLELCENFVATNEGPIVKRPGFEYIRDADATASWLSAFRYSITQEYVIQWCDEKARFFTNGLQIETAPGVAYEITTPYAADDAPMLSTQQSFDRLYIDHGSYPPAALARTSATTFVHADSELLNGPFLDQNGDVTLTLQASGSAVGATVTVTASAALFTLQDVGRLIEIEAIDFSDMKAWEALMDGIAVNDIVRSNGNAYTALTAGKTGSLPPIHVRGSEWDGQNKNDVLNAKGPYAVKWAYRHGRRGMVKITGFTDSTHVTAEVIQRLPDSVVTTPTDLWALGAWSQATGWPSVVLNAYGRQIHFKGFDVVGSVVGDYGGGRVNFARYSSAGTLTADMAFRRTIATEDPVLWAVMSGKKIVVGTASKELALGAINSAVAISGDNIAADPQSFYGCEPVFPVLIGTEAVFVERGGRRIRASDYDIGRERYAANDMTAAARHITRSGIIQLATQRLPYALLYGVRADGQLVVHSNTKLEIKGWARTVLGGEAKVISAVSVIGADGKTDELWCLVERERADGIKREMWRQVAWRELGDPQEECFFVDGGVRIEAYASQNEFTGLTHLAGQDVAVLANGGVVPDMTVANDGKLLLPATAVPNQSYTLIVGLRYTATAITLRPEVRQRGETVQGTKQRLVNAVLRMLDTLGIRVGDYDGPDEEIIDRPGNAPMDKAIPLFSGDKVATVDGQFDRQGQMKFTSSDPLPCIVQASMLSIDVDQSNG